MPRRPTCSNLVDCDVGLNHSHASVRGTAEIGSLLRLPCARPIIDNDPCAASSERNGCCSTEPRSRAGYQRTHSVECRHASSPDVGCASGRTRTIERDTKGAKTRFIAPAYGKFESSSLQQRVRCELDLAARKSQKGQLGTRAASAAHAPRAAEAAARTQVSRSGSVEQPCIRPTRYIIPPTRARHPALGSTARTPLPGLTPRSPIG